MIGSYRYAPSTGRLGCLHSTDSMPIGADFDTQGIVCDRLTCLVHIMRAICATGGIGTSLGMFQALD